MDPARRQLIARLLRAARGLSDSELSGLVVAAEWRQRLMTEIDLGRSDLAMAGRGPWYAVLERYAVLDPAADDSAPRWCVVDIDGAVVVANLTDEVAMRLARTLNNGATAPATDRQ